jgi:hypothetical protein
MTEVSFKGSGTPVIDQNSASGLGQGLQTGETSIDFTQGNIQLTSSKGAKALIGKFIGFFSQDSPSSTIKAFVFKAAVACTIKIGNATFDYVLVNQWVTFRYINIGQIVITKLATGASPDIFAWLFFASDNPDFDFTIQPSSKDSEPEMIFESAPQIQGTITKNTNLRGAQKIILTGVSANIGETGVATVTMEVFDAASGLWITLVPNQDLFTLIANQQKIAEVGDTISKSPILSQWGDLSPPIAINPAIANQTLDGNINSNGVSGVGSSIGHALPSGDNLVRVKVVITVSTLTFSIGIIKVYS